MAGGIAELARSGRAVDVRLLVGTYPLGAGPDATTLLRQLAQAAGVPSSRLSLYVAEMRSCLGTEECDSFTWNHAKFVAVDGREALSGGINFWTGDYLEAQPVLDLSMQLRGPAAADASRFADALWRFVCARDGKGGNGTVYIPLQPDDPLYNPATPHTNFMVMTRATLGDGAANVTTPWVDQNQTYTSHPSHQVFLRDYAAGPDGPLATGHLLEGARGMSTWADVKAQARDLLGIELTDLDVGAVPVLLTDPYGEFIRGPNGLPQILAAFDVDGNAIWVEGDLADPVNPSAIQLPVGTVLVDPSRRHSARVRADGSLVTADAVGSIHKIGAHVMGATACNGWVFWHMQVEGKLVPIDILRQKLRAGLT